MPPKRGRRKVTQFIDPDDEEVDEVVQNAPTFKLTTENLEELQKIDIEKYPIPDRFGAAYTNNGKDRLIIDKMVMTNFKSYYGRQTAGPFHPHFTAIVGANGSGKSNIIDALMFVFGFKAKKIRSDKLQALIHNSVGIETPKSASVQIYFVKVREEDDKRTVLRDTGFVVERTVNQNGTSKFYYDKKVVTREILIKRLLDQGIDMEHNRFLILQGEVEQISLMKAKALNENEDGLLEYLDDIIGTSRLKPMVQDLEAKVTAAHDAKQEQIFKIRQAEQKKNELIGPVRDMVIILKLENQIAQCKYTIYVLQIHRGLKKLQQLKEKSSHFEESLVAKTDRLKEILESVENAKKSMTGQQNELEDLKNKLKKEVDQLKKNELFLTTEKKHINKKEKELKALEATKSTSLKTIEELKGKPEEYENEIEELKVEHETAIEKREEARPEYEQKSKEAREASTSLMAESNKIAGELTQAKLAVDKTEAELSQLENKKKNLDEPYKMAKSRFDSCKKTLDDVVNSFEQNQTKLQNYKEKMPNLQQEFDKLNRERRRLQEDDRAAVSKYENLKGQLNAASLEQTTRRDKNTCLKTLVDEKRKGNITGIIGRLGDLGAIDGKYDYAISAVSNLDQIVCQDQESVNQCLAVVQARKLPRTQFIALNSVPDRISERIETPMNLPRIFDLVKPDKPEYRKAFYKILNDVLVTDRDIGEAYKASQTRIGGNRFTVVTTLGQIASSAGHLTGGGNSASTAKGALRLLNDRIPHNEVDIEALTIEVEKAYEAMSTVRRALGQVEQKANAVENELKEHRIGSTDLERRVTTAKETIANLKKNLELCEGEMEKEKKNCGEEKVAELDAEIETANSRKVKLKEKSDEVQRRFDKCKKKLEDVHTEICGNSKKVFEEWESTVKELEKKIAELKKKANKTANDLKSLERNIEPTNQQIDSLKSEIDGRKKTLEETAVKIESLKKVVEEKQKQVDKLTKWIDEETSKITQTDAEEISLKKQIKELETELKGLNEQILNQQTKIANFEKRKEVLKLHSVQEFLSDEALKKKKQKSAKKKRVLNEDSDDSSDSSETDEDERMVVDTTEDEVEEENCDKFPVLTPGDLEQMQIDSVEAKLEDLESLKSGKKTTINMALLDDYRKRLREYNEQHAYLKKIDDAIDKVQGVYDKFVNQRLQEFTDALTMINRYLQDQYYHLSLGGEARLQPISPLDAYAEGIRFNVRPQSKGWREISQTSGGEKTLSSLSLVFALHQYQPAPFYVMDEIDAALDFKNVKMIARFVKEKTKNSQFIIISLRDNMYQTANRLIGVTKLYGKASMIVLSFPNKDKEDMENKQKKKPQTIMPA